MAGQLIDIHTSRGIPGTTWRIAIYRQNFQHALDKIVDFARHQVESIFKNISIFIFNSNWRVA